MMGIRGRSVLRSPGPRTQAIREHLRLPSLLATESLGCQMFRQHHGKGHRPSRSTIENSCRNKAAARTQGGGPASPRAQSTKNSSARCYGLRALVGRRGGFLRSPPARPTGGPQRIIRGAGQKRKNIGEGKAGSKCARIRAVVNRFFSSLNATLASGVHVQSLALPFVSSVSERATLE